MDMLWFESVCLTKSINDLSPENSYTIN
jgi:hypothetical protein